MKSDPPHDDPLQEMIGEIVALDTQGTLLYIGRLTRLGHGFLELCEADVHDRRDGRATKELYLAETKVLGVRANRERVVVARSEVASVSLLKDIRES